MPDTAGSGKHVQTSLRGIAIKACRMPCAEASATEEPDAGKPHVLCVGCRVTGIPTTTP